MNHYDTLGLKQNCSQADVQKAYRKLAKQHHPDTGGDTATFHKINEAYDTLKDPKKRQEFDFSNSQQNINFDKSSFSDIFNIFGHAGFHPSKRSYKRQIRNKDLNIHIECTLYDILSAQEKHISVKHLDGTRKFVTITIPRGVINGAKIKYAKLGDATHKKLPPGDLIATIQVLKHPIFERDENNLKMDFTINSFDAIIGRSIGIKTLHNKTLNINIPAGTQYGTVFKIPDYGIKTKNKLGDLFVRILIKTPENLNEEQLNICRRLIDENK